MAEAEVRQMTVRELARRLQRGERWTVHESRLPRADPAALDCEEVGDMVQEHATCLKAILWACAFGAVVGFVTGWAL